MFSFLLATMCMQYVHVGTVANFTNAQLLCNDLGMELVVIKDATTNDEITSYLSANSV